MNAKHRFVLAVVVLGLLMTGPFIVTSLLVWLDMKGDEREMLTELLISRMPIGTMMTVFGFARHRLGQDAGLPPLPARPRPPPGDGNCVPGAKAWGR